MINISTALAAFLSMASIFYICAAGIMIIHCFFDNGIVWTRKKACVLGIFVAISVIWETFFTKPDFVSSLCFALLYIIIPIWGCRKKLIRRALNLAGTYFTIMFCAVCVILIAFSYLLPGFDVNAETLPLREESLIHISTIIFFGPIFHYLNHRIAKKGLFIPCGKRERFVLLFYVMFVIATCAVIVFSSYALGNWSRSVQAMMSVICILFMLIIPIFVFHSRISDSYRKIYEYQETYLEAELEHFRRYKLAQEETARFRHDIKNNLICLDELFSVGKTDEAAQYLASLLDEVRSLSPTYVSGDEVLDCIISAKAATMERDGIAFTLDGVIAGGLDWKAIDICSVFANALDNAAETCAKLPPEQRKITMSLKSTDCLRYVRIENPVAEAVDVSRLFNEMGGYTTKKQSANHGLGTYNMKRTTEKYGGIIRAECENGLFALELIINK